MATNQPVTITDPSKLKELVAVCGITTTTTPNLAYFDGNRNQFGANLDMLLMDVNLLVINGQ